MGEARIPHGSGRRARFGAVLAGLLLPVLAGTAGPNVLDAEAISWKPNAFPVARWKNHGDQTLRAVRFWWAPDGRREVLDGVYASTEPPPADPGPGVVAPGRSRAQDDGMAPAAAALAVLDAFMAAFNARDLEAWEATYHFPHFRMADGALTILSAAGERSPALFEALAATGWHHSAWLSREVVQAGPDKVHVAVEFARYRADGSELARYASLYVVTREEGRWGIRGRSSFAP